MPDHTTQDDKRRPQTETRKENGTWTLQNSKQEARSQAVDWAPSKGVRSQVRCRWPEPAGRKGGGRNALRQRIRSARHSGQRLLMRAWRSTSHARHTKCAKRGAGHAHPDRPFTHERGHEPASGGQGVELLLAPETD